MSAPKKVGKYLISEDFCIANGSMSKLYKAKSSLSGRDVICKKVDKTLLVKTLRQDELQKEIELLKRLRYKHVLQFFDVMQSKHAIYVIVEYSCKNLKVRYREGMTKELVREVFTQLTLAVMHVHSRGVAHREVHPGNVMLSPFDEVKLSGFTNATRVSQPSQFIKHRNTHINFLAPELLRPDERRNPKHEKSDLWGLGVTLFYLENGVAPFDNGPEEELVNRICRGLYQMTKQMTKDAKDICAKLVTTDARRAGLDILVTHKYLDVEASEVAEAKGKKADSTAEKQDAEVTVFNLAPGVAGEHILTTTVLDEGNKDPNAALHNVGNDDLPPQAPLTTRRASDPYSAPKLANGVVAGGVFRTHTTNAKQSNFP
eukprot:TRINITY_DN2524_c0_g2_i1.p1 TRINITY_DN2524_c0_g2~~TRINITY_DN2524_c0_g2_i1.p1  ORF type:complete len:373 (+),score=87.50 TRINITY_DN2524_c0_g2_i1:41-1159(+)